MVNYITLPVVNNVANVVFLVKIWQRLNLITVLYAECTCRVQPFSNVLPTALVIRSP